MNLNRRRHQNQRDPQPVTAAMGVEATGRRTVAVAVAAAAEGEDGDELRATRSRRMLLPHGVASSTPTHPEAPLRACHSFTSVRPGKSEASRNLRPRFGDSDDCDGSGADGTSGGGKGIVLQVVMTESTFLRAVALVNMAVQRQTVAGGEGRCSSTALYAGLVACSGGGRRGDENGVLSGHLSSRVTLLRRQVRAAKSLFVAPVRVSVYHDAVLIEDRNGPDAHRQLTAAFRTMLDEKGSSAAGGSVRDGAMYRRVAWRSGMANGRMETDEDGREVGDCLVLGVWAERRRREVLESLQQGYLPGVLLAAYPEGVQLIGEWHGGEAARDGDVLHHPTVMGLSELPSEGQSATRRPPPLLLNAPPPLCLAAPIVSRTPGVTVLTPKGVLRFVAGVGGSVLRPSDDATAPGRDASGGSTPTPSVSLRVVQPWSWEALVAAIAAAFQSAQQRHLVEGSDEARNYPRCWGLWLGLPASPSATESDVGRSCGRLVATVSLPALFPRSQHAPSQEDAEPSCRVMCDAPSLEPQQTSTRSTGEPVASTCGTSIVLRLTAMPSGSYQPAP